MSIPLLIITTNPDSHNWISKYETHKMIYFSLSTALNVVFTTLLVVRLCMLRPKVEQVLGKIQSAYYTSFFTTIVESGAILTMWEVVHLGLLVKGVSTAEVFQQPIVYLNVSDFPLLLGPGADRGYAGDHSNAHRPSYGTESRLVSRHGHRFCNRRTRLAGLFISQLRRTSLPQRLPLYTSTFSQPQIEIRPRLFRF
jgi:hypothetical protein